MASCPQCGESLVKNIKLKKSYCPSCGYQIRFEDEIKEIKIEETPSKESRLTVQEMEEEIHAKRIKESLDKNYITACPKCGGDFVFEEGKIFCKICGEIHQVSPTEAPIKTFRINNRSQRKIGFFCNSCGEKYSVINGEVCCKTCDAELVEEDKQAESAKKQDYVCPKCKGEYFYDEITGKIACKDCGYQPQIENKEYVIDTDNSKVKTIECDRCGSNSGYDIREDKIICKSCGEEMDKKQALGKKHKKSIDKDGIVAKRLSKKTLRCKNCGDMVEGFDFYKTEFCPSCGTLNVVIEDIGSLRVEPDKIIPYVLNAENAAKAVGNYGKTKGLEIKLSGTWKKVYVPFWQFHYEGAKIRFRKKHSFEDKEGRVKSLVLEEGKEEILLDDIWISAKEEFAESFDLNKTDMTKAVDYMPEALDTLTERYDIGTTEAEVLAKDRVYDYLYDLLWNRKKTLKLMFFNFLELDYGTYKNEFQQVLIPTWQNICEINNENYFFTVNGQNGEVKISGLDLEERVEREKSEEVLEKGRKVLNELDEFISWFPTR